MNSEKTLRTLLIVTLVISVVQFLNYFVQLLSSVLFPPRNPLIPKYLTKYIVFSLTIMSLIFLVLGIYAFYNMRTKRYSQVKIYFVFLVTISCVLFGADVYQFINSFNPYAS